MRLSFFYTFIVIWCSVSSAALVSWPPFISAFNRWWPRHPVRGSDQDRRLSQRHYVFEMDKENKENVSEMRVNFNLTPESEECKCQSWLICLLDGGRPITKEAGCSSIFQTCCSTWGSLDWWSKLASTTGYDEARNLDPVSYSSSESEMKLETTESGRSREARHMSSIFEVGEMEKRPMSCGRSLNAQRKIMGGRDAGYGQFPWTALIRIKLEKETDKECSGTLIHPRFVLTAGHCVTYCMINEDNKEGQGCVRERPYHSIKYIVSLGEYDRSSLSELYPVAEYRAIDVIRHPRYINVIRTQSLQSEPRFDVALLLLDRSVDVLPNVAPICLPDSESAVAALLRPESMATIVGWGRLGPMEDAPHARVLQAVSLPVLDDTQCLRETGLTNFDDQVCVGTSDAHKSVCPGDSGSALQMTDEHGHWTILGIVSNGPRVCGLQPVVFHRLEASIQWIREVINEYDIVQSLP